MAAVLTEGRSKREVDRQYKVSCRWVVTLVQRYLAEGEAGLAPRSRRSHRSPQQTAAQIEEQIISIRKELSGSRCREPGAGSAPPTPTWSACAIALQWGQLGAVPSRPDASSGCPTSVASQ